MNKSEQINELAAALAKAQLEIKGAVKDSENPYFKSHYADLAAVWEACREPLSKNGLCVIQVSDTDSEGHVFLETMLAHSSGQWISGRQGMVPVKADPQGWGSCTTYFRRYGLAAIVGIAQVDDDANEASGKPKVGTQAAANYIRDEKLKASGFDDKHDELKKSSKVVPPAPTLPEGEQVITGLLSHVSAEMPTKKGAPFISVEVGPHKFNVFDKKSFDAVRGFKGKEVSCIVRKEGKYLNFVAMEQAASQVEKEPEDPFALANDDSEVPF